MMTRKKTAYFLLHAFVNKFFQRKITGFRKEAWMMVVLMATSLLMFGQAPTISSFSPALAASGATITITGTNFSGSTAVSFGGTAATSFIIVSSTQITAVVGSGNNGSVAVTSPGGTGTRAGFYYQSLNRVITDFGGYWSSALLSPNATKPDNSHNVLAFGYNNTIYSTGVNDAKLTTNGVTFTSGSFRALPVAGISGTNPGGSVYLALAKLVDGSTNIANPATVSNYTLKTVLTDGVQGLNLGTGFTNLPASALLTFNIYGIVNAKIADAEPDILLTQIAQPSAGNDVFSLVDASGVLVGNTVTQDMTQLSPFGSYDLDLFNMTPNAPFNTATAFSASTANTNREIRLVAFKLSDFGITTGNASQVKALKITPSTNSDYAFIAYNTASLNLPPNITQNSYNSNTSICSGGTAAMEVIATAASGGSLTYNWERSTNGGGSWTAVNDGGNYSGATTNRLQVANAANADQYRATVTESGSGLSSTSAAFTIAVIAPTAPTSVTVAGGATVCLNTASQLTSTVSGGSNLYYQWQSSPTVSGTYTNISGANSNFYIPPVAATGATSYKVVVSSGSGCGSAVTSATPATMTITGISSTTNGSRCSTGTVGLVAAATAGTIDWYAADAGGASLYTGTNFTTPGISSTTTYYVASSGCSSALRVPVTATVNPSGQWVGGSSGDWNVAANWCSGIPGSSTNVVIPAGAVVNIQGANAVANSISIGSSGSLIMSGNYNLSITAGGSITNNGSFDATASSGKVVFLGNGSISGTTTFKNIDANGAVDFGSASTVSGNFTLQAGGSVTGNAPIYTCPGATLIYNTTGTYTRGLEWSTGASGKGYPANVTIQNNTTINFPVTGDGYVCNNLNIAAGSSLSQNYGGGSAGLQVGKDITISGTLSLGNSSGGDISLGGNWTRNTGGVFAHNGRTVTFTGTGNFSGNGTTASYITAPASSAKDNEGGFGGENFGTVVMNKTNTTDSVILLSNITVTRSIGFTKGTFSLRSSDVTIVSNSTRTAYVAPVITPSNAVVRYGGSGRFVIQRFIQNPGSVRSWRLLTAPLEAGSAPTINDAWQEGATNPDKANPNGSGGIYNPWPGYGTHITGTAGTYSAANGFDQGTNSGSILYAGGGVSSWLTPSSTKSTSILDQPGWMLFVRGDRSFVIGNQYAASQNTLLEPKGKINIGDVSKSISSGKQVVGNPYASAISMLDVNIAGTPGKNSTFYMWDPKMFTSYTQPGKWVTFTGMGTDFDYTTSSSTYPTNGTIESGQAFVINAASSGTIVFHETDKLAAAGSLTGISNRPSAPADNPTGLVAKFRTDLLVNSNNEYLLTDGVLNLYHSSFNSDVDEYDAPKFVTFNTKESLGTLRSNSNLAIEKRSPVINTDTIFLNFTRLNLIAYRFKFTATNFSPVLTASLHDKFTGQNTPITLSGSNTVDFTISSDPLSAAADRFMVIFKTANVLPVTFKAVNISSPNKLLAVEWQMENELNVKRYEVEKSNDGSHFSVVHNRITNGVQASSYKWVADNGFAAEGFFRVKCVLRDESFFYSKTVAINAVKNSNSISIYPNPVTDHNIHLQLNNCKAGKYFVHIFSSNGNLVVTTSLVYNGGTASQVISMPAELSKGKYLLEMIHPGGEKTVESVLVK